MRIFNTKEEDVNLIISTIELQKFETVDKCVLSTPGPRKPDKLYQNLANSTSEDNENLNNSYLPFENISSNKTSEPDAQTSSPLGQDNNARKLEHLAYETEITEFAQPTKVATSPSHIRSSLTLPCRLVADKTNELYTKALQNINLESLNTEKVRTAEVIIKESLNLFTGDKLTFIIYKFRIYKIL